MKRERLAWLSALFVACNGLVWASMTGCSGDDTSGDAGPDGSGDVKNDSPKDAPPPDTGSDADAGDASDAPDVFDASLLIEFKTDFATQFCKTVGTACFKDQLDAGLPDAELSNCVAAITANGGGGGIENSIYDLDDPAALNGGHISLNQTARASCLAGLGTMSLPNITGSEYATIAQNCTGALVGDIPNGQGCHETAECATGFCTYDKDAGVPDGSSGVCIPTGVTGAPCGSGRGSGNEECMHRGWQGNTPLKCEYYTADGGPGSMTCVAKSANGSYCVYEWECASNTCDDNYSCNTATTAWNYLYVGQCPIYFPDAGLQ